MYAQELEVNPMAPELRKTGISVVGEVAWGTHFCHFYETKQDLLDTLIPYFKVGLESKEFCLWVVSDSEIITVAEARGALAQVVPDLDRHIADGNIEILNGHDWYLEDNVLNLERVTSAWNEKLKRALARGYDGMRASADTFWVAEKDWKDFFAYEKQINDWITDQRMTVSCTYPMAKSGAAEVLDVVQTHQFAIARRQGEWEVIETPELIQAKAEIKKLNEELEQRVAERTNELAAANEELRREIAERKRAEALLHAKEQEFRAIVENAPDQIIRYDKEFRRTYVNPAVARAYGLPAQALIGKPIGSVIQDAGLDVKEGELAQVRQRITAVFETGKSFEYEMTWPTPTGRKYYSVRLFPECDLNGSVGNVLGISRDITERKRTERRLREYEKAVEGLDEMIAVVDRDHRYLLANRAFLKYRGLEREELVGRLVPEVLNPAVFESVTKRKLDECFEGSVIVKYESKYDYPSLGERDLLISYFPIEGASGVDRVACVLKDITEAKRAEEALRASETKFRRLLESSIIGVVFWDLHGDLFGANDLFLDMIGYTREDLQQGRLSWKNLTPPEYARVDDRAIAELLATGTCVPFEKEYIRKDGGRISVLIGSAMLEGHNDKGSSFIMDITERKLAEANLRETTEQLRALSARFQSAREEEGMRIAREIHDELGSALTSLKWDLEGMEKMLSDPKSGSELASMKGKAHTMTRLVDGTIDVVRRISAELRPSALDDLGLMPAIEWHAQQFQVRTGIVCDCDFPFERAGLNQAQSTAVFRILQEALTNVLRHAQATRVSIRAAEEAGEFILTISDNGKGISEDGTSGLKSLGLLGMRERAILIGGKVDIAGVEGKGTVITLKVPIGRAGRTFGAGK
jgi:PAS domain S-box-containing protein